MLNLQQVAKSSPRQIGCSAEEKDTRCRVPCVQHVSFLGGAKCGSTLVFDLLTGDFPMLFHPSNGKERCSFMQTWWGLQAQISACSAEAYRRSYNTSNGLDICKETSGRVKFTLDGCPVYGYWDSPQQRAAFRKSDCAFGDNHLKWLFLVRDPMHKMISSWNYEKDDKKHGGNVISAFVEEVLDGKHERSLRESQ